MALFTGIREGEVCGLQWDCVDFDNGTILIDKQLQSLRGKVRGDREKYTLIPTKNGKGRTITAGKVPNVVGMGLSDALFLLESCGAEVKVTGAGCVVHQSLAPGTTIASGEQIKIQLK